MASERLGMVAIGGVITDVTDGDNFLMKGSGEHSIGMTSSSFSSISRCSAIPPPLPPPPLLSPDVKYSCFCALLLSEFKPTIISLDPSCSFCAPCLLAGQDTEVRPATLSLNPEKAVVSLDLLSSPLVGLLA